MFRPEAKSVDSNSSLKHSDNAADKNSLNTADELALRIENLGKRVVMQDQTLEILQGIGLEIKQGETLAIVGRSGSGKTTLLGLMAGLDEATEGHVVMMGQSLSELSEDQRAAIRAEYVGFVFQSFHLLPALTALENVMLPLELKGGNARQEASRFLEEVGLGDRLNHFPPQLSGGEQQRVAVARAFACRPKILFADEPTGNLDTETGSEIIKLLFRLNQQQQTTLVMVTHDDSLAEQCERIVRLEAGMVVDLKEKAGVA